MKKLLTVLLFLLLTFTMFAQEEQPMDQDQMQAWMDFMTPGQAHSKLAKVAGEWDVLQKYWMSPGTEPMETEVKATAEMIMGGRYLVTKHTGMVMGMPFEGMSIEGYDNATEKYVSIWIDNLGTGIGYAEGSYDNATGVLAYEGTMTDPMTKKASWFKQTMQTVDDNTIQFEMFMKAPDGSEFKNMEVTYTKNKM